MGGSCVPVGQAVIQLEADGRVHDGVTLTILPTGMLRTPEILIGKDLLDQGLVTVYCEERAFILPPSAVSGVSKFLPEAVAFLGGGGRGADRPGRLRLPSL